RAEQHAAHGGGSHEQAVEHAHVPVGALHRGGEPGDDHDRPERGPPPLALAIAQPEHEQRHDHGPAADPEQPAEQARGGADRHQLQRAFRERLDARAPLCPGRGSPIWWGHRSRWKRAGSETWSDSATALAILVSVSPAATLVEALEPLRCDPPHAAVLLDIDGTLAPIVRHADDAHVPEATRSLLIESAKRYGLVGCVSGRRASTARQIVAIGTIAYIGNHGGELLLPGATRPQLDTDLAAWAPRVR